MMRSNFLGAVALAAGLLASTSGEAADGPPAAASSPLANACQSSLPPATRIAACEALLRAPALPPHLAAAALFSIGFSRQDLHDPDGALLNFTGALQKDPTFWPAAWARAELLGARREYAAALQDWNQVLIRQPNLAGAFAAQAEMADDTGRSEEAVAGYTKAIAIASADDPVDQFYAERGVAQAGAQHFDLAIADYGQAIQRNGQNDRAYANRGRALFLKGDAAQAVGDFRKAAELAPADLYHALWLYLAETEAGQDAAGDLRERIGQLPLARWPGPLVRVFLGEVKPEQVPAASATPAAWSAADRAAAAACERAFFLGELYQLRGQKDQAIASFQAAVATHVQEYIEYHAAQAELARLAR